MRRIVGLVLAGLGTCLIVFSVLMPTYVSNRVHKFPLNEFATATLIDNHASYFSPVKLTEMSPVTMEATYTLKGNKEAGSSSTAVWNQFIYVYDLTNKQPFQTMTRTLAFDRHNAKLINCCGSNVNGNSSVQQSGYVGYVFPIGTQKQTYDVYDANALKPVPFNYAGTDTVNGIQAYRFVENLSPTQNGTRVVPGSLVGMTQASVTLPQFYQAHVTYWIDPETGALLKATQDEKVFLENSSGAQALLLFNGNLVMTPDSVKGLVALDNSERNKKTAVDIILPLVAGIIGVALLVIGLLLYRRSRVDVHAPLAAPSPEQAASREATPPAQASLVPGLDDQPRESAVHSPPERESAVHSPEAVAPESSQPQSQAHLPATTAAEAPGPQAPGPEAPGPEEARAAEPPDAEAATTPQSAVPADAEAEDSATTMPQQRPHRGVHRR